MNTKKFRYFLKVIPDKPYLQICYRIKTGKKLDLKHPMTFNEKLQWLKLYDRKPEYTIMVDKYRVREYIRSKIGEEYIIPLVGGPWCHADEIDFAALPEQFVLKCNHDSGSVVICKDKRKLNYEEVKRKLNNCLKHNFWHLGREWPYKNVKPCIIAETYLEDESGKELKDYKIFNFSGKPQIIQIDYNRFSGHKRNLYSTDWNRMNAMLEYPANENVALPRPPALEKLLRLSAKLSEGYPFLRTDFYVTEGKIFFGELTFYPESGFGKFRPEEWDERMGKFLKLPNSGSMNSQ